MTKRETAKPADPALLPAPSTPIVEALLSLRSARIITPDDADTCALLLGVRTFGDLIAVLGRDGDVLDAATAERLRATLGVTG